MGGLGGSGSGGEGGAGGGEGGAGGGEGGAGGGEGGACGEGSSRLSGSGSVRRSSNNVSVVAERSRASGGRSEEGAVGGGSGTV